MTIFLIDFQDLTIFGGLHQPANRIILVVAVAGAAAVGAAASPFRGGPPLFFLLCLLFFPILQTNTGRRLPLQFSINDVLCGPA